MPNFKTEWCWILLVLLTVSKVIMRAKFGVIFDNFFS